MKKIKYYLWSYKAQQRWHKSTVYLSDDGMSTDGNYYNVIHTSKEKIRHDNECIEQDAAQETDLPELEMDKGKL